MRIALVSPLYESVPPAMYGGTERVIAALADELVHRGHDVTLFAPGGSDTAAKLVPCCSAPLRMTMSRIDLEQVAPHLHLRMLNEVYQRSDEFDIIHAHTDIWTLPFLDTTKTPTVITMHGRLDLEVIDKVLPLYPNATLVSISDSQRRDVDHLEINWAATCYNGLDLASYRAAPEPSEEYLLFVGRLTSEKRPDWAIEIATRAGLKLKIAAKIDPLDQEYFKEVIEPLIDYHNNVEFIGEVTEQDKPKLFGGALATLFPIDWPEPFGLVMIESMAAGTPVIALDNGSVPEVVRDGTSGLICKSIDEMVSAVETCRKLDRAAVRRGAERFSAAAMTDGYLEVYSRLLAHRAQRNGVVVRDGDTLILS